MQHLIFEFNHQIEDVIPFCEFIQTLKPKTQVHDIGSYLGDDMSIDGGDAEATFECRDAKMLLSLSYLCLSSFLFMPMPRQLWFLIRLKADQKKPLFT